MHIDTVSIFFMACRLCLGLLYYYRAQFLRAAAHVVVSCEITFVKKLKNTVMSSTSNVQISK